ncbi:Integrase core domain protein [compost metagenome]
MAFRKALKQQHGGGELIDHSDRGVQYCSGQYQLLHERHGVRCSMTDGYDCDQSALAEWVNGILKGELLLQSPQDLAHARDMVRKAVGIYNLERPHQALKYRTPDAVHRGF